MRIFKRIIGATTFILFLIFIFLNAKIWLLDKDDHYVQGYFSKNIDDAIKMKTIIAEYIYLNNTGIQQKLYLERVKKIDECKYLFLNSCSYADTYTLNPKLGVPFKLCKTVVTGEGDTLAYPGVKSTNRIPNYLKFYPWNENSPPFIFRLYKIYDENIKSKPSIPLSDYFSMGPYFNNW